MPKHDPNARTALYRLLAANGRLLYVGIAANPDSRWGQHSTNQHWWNDVADRKIEWFPNRAAAATAEVAAIKAERPLHNIQHAVVDKPVIPTQRHDDWPPPPSDAADRLPFRHLNAQMPGQLADVRAERRLLGSVLRSRRAVQDALCVLEPSDFYRPSHGLIWAAVVGVDTRGDIANPITVAAELAKRDEIVRSGGIENLRALHGEVSSSVNACHYAAVVHALGVARRWAEEQSKPKI